MQQSSPPGTAYVILRLNVYCLLSRESLSKQIHRSPMRVDEGHTRKAPATRHHLYSLRARSSCNRSTRRNASLLLCPRLSTSRKPLTMASSRSRVNPRSSESGALVGRGTNTKNTTCSDA